MRVLSYCVMSNHWHLVLWPRRDGELARFMLRLTTMHVRRWLINRSQVGTGHVYQGRYKSFAMQDDEHLTTVCRYVERNPVRANRVEKSVEWLWSSIGQPALLPELQMQLTALPIQRRKDWTNWVDRPQTAAEEAAITRCIEQSRPYGDDEWIERYKKRLGWREPLRHGRPKTGSRGET